MCAARSGTTTCRQGPADVDYHIFIQGIELSRIVFEKAIKNRDSGYCFKIQGIGVTIPRECTLSAIVKNISGVHRETQC
jgi:hypothetical protein